MKNAWNSQARHLKIITISISHHKHYPVVNVSISQLKIGSTVLSKLISILYKVESHIAHYKTMHDLSSEREKLIK